MWIISLKGILSKERISVSLNIFGNFAILFSSLMPRITGKFSLISEYFSKDSHVFLQDLFTFPLQDFFEFILFFFLQLRIFISERGANQILCMLKYTFLHNVAQSKKYYRQNEKF